MHIILRFVILKPPKMSGGATVPPKKLRVRKKILYFKTKY